MHQASSSELLLSFKTLWLYYKPNLILQFHIIEVGLNGLKYCHLPSSAPLLLFMAGGNQNNLMSPEFVINSFSQDF